MRSANVPLLVSSEQEGPDSYPMIGTTPAVMVEAMVIATTRL